MIDKDDFQSGLAPIEGTQLYYEIAGKGPWLVLLHAGIADRRMWDDQWSAFASHYRLLRYDMRGYGRSPMTPGAFSNRQDLYRLLSFLGIDQAAFIGCSMGGTTAIDFALEHPRMVRSLVLVSATMSGFRATGQPPAQIFELIDALKAGDFERAADLQVQIWVDGFRRGQEQADAGVRLRVRRMSLDSRINQGEFLKSTGFIMEEPLQPPALERLSQLTMPVLAIAGDLDDDNILRAAELLAEKLPAARKEIIHGAAHLPNMEKSEEFNRLTLEFLQSSPG
jgi:pimeloyl-ACP methyl ester carboxylesterase